MQRSNISIYNFTVLVIVLLLSVSYMGFSQEVVYREWRDVLGKYGLLAQDEKDLLFLDNLMQVKQTSKEDIEELKRIFRTSDSLSVICHALATTCTLESVPDSIIDEINLLARQENGAVLIQIVRVFGLLAIPRTFSTVYSLRERKYPYFCELVLVILPKFGVYAISALPDVLSKEPKFRDQRVSPFIVTDFIHQLPRSLLSLTCIGSGFIVPYSPWQLSEKYLPGMSLEPALPKIKAMLQSLKGAQ